MYKATASITQYALWLVVTCLNYILLLNCYQLKEHAVICNHLHVGIKHYF
jgi:hypothetical protein